MYIHGISCQLFQQLDIDLTYPMTLTYKLDLDILPLDRSPSQEYVASLIGQL